MKSNLELLRICFKHQELCCGFCFPRRYSDEVPMQRSYQEGSLGSCCGGDICHRRKFVARLHAEYREMAIPSWHIDQPSGRVEREIVRVASRWKMCDHFP